MESQQADAHTQALLVEDNETLCNIWTGAFRDAGHGTTEAATLQDALGPLGVARLDVVVSVPHFPGGRADPIPDALRQTGAKSGLIITTSGANLLNGARNSCLTDTPWLAKPRALGDPLASLARAASRCGAECGCIWHRPETVVTTGGTSWLTAYWS